MFIATGAARSPKLRRSGMYSCSTGHCRRAVEAKIPTDAAPTELGRKSKVVVTINMALLTELYRPPPPNMRVRSSVLARSKVVKRRSLNEIGRVGAFGACCARGRAHSYNVSAGRH
jgi:hypothetical protein